jgi:hypothetical protein
MSLSKHADEASPPVYEFRVCVCNGCIPHPAHGECDYVEVKHPRTCTETACTTGHGPAPRSWRRASCSGLVGRWLRHRWIGGELRRWTASSFRRIRLVPGAEVGSRLPNTAPPALHSQAVGEVAGGGEGDLVVWAGFSCWSNPNKSQQCSLLLSRSGQWFEKSVWTKKIGSLQI